MKTTAQEVISDINLVSSFLAASQFSSSGQLPSPDCIVIAASAVLYGAETVFQQLQNGKLKTRTLVLCGGVGHSTSLIYEAVAKSSAYAELAESVQGLPEARVLEVLLGYISNGHVLDQSGCRVLIEDKSTNCGANALETRKVLERAGVSAPRSLMVVQDPTMQRRTIASFEKVYSNMEVPPLFYSYPLLVPKVKLLGSAIAPDEQMDIVQLIQYDNPEVSEEQLWELTRFLELIMGEIPRLRDDENGYGPEGKGFISHVDVPENVEFAWRRLKSQLNTTR